jgi:hypothetical protein
MGARGVTTCIVRAITVTAGAFTYIRTGRNSTIFWPHRPLNSSSFSAVVGYDVTLDFIGTRPCETAEWASASWLVYVPQVPLQLLGPYKVSIAVCTGRSHPAARGSTFAGAPRALNGYTISCSTGLSLGHVSLHSNHRKPDSACLVGWKVGLWPHLDANGQSCYRRGRVAVLEVPRSRSLIQCWPSMIVSNGYFKGRVAERLSVGALARA